MFKKLLSIVLATIMAVGMGATAFATDTQIVEFQGPTGTYIKVSDGIYKLEPNAPTTRYIPKPACHGCGNAKFIVAKNTFLMEDYSGCGCSVFYNGHACYYCGARYIDKEWTNHKPNCGTNISKR